VQERRLCLIPITNSAGVSLGQTQPLPDILLNFWLVDVLRELDEVASLATILIYTSLYGFSASSGSDKYPPISLSTEMVQDLTGPSSVQHSSSPTPSLPPSNDDIEAVIQMATSARSTPDGRGGLRDTRTQLFVGNVRACFDILKLV
jgi:hypothetical protein